MKKRICTYECACPRAHKGNKSSKVVRRCVRWDALQWSPRMRCGSCSRAGRQEERNSCPECSMQRLPLMERSKQNKELWCVKRCEMAANNQCIAARLCRIIKAEQPVRNVLRKKYRTLCARNRHAKKVMQTARAVKETRKESSTRTSEFSVVLHLTGVPNCPNV